MEYRVLGPLEVRDGGRSLPLAGAKQRALLALLLVNANHVLSRDRLIDELWGDEPPETAVQSLQVYVSRLRKLLPADTLLTRPPGYLLEVGPDELDLQRFERLLADGHEALAEGDAARASSVLQEALALWRGPALAEFAYEPFAQPEIGRLEDLRLAAVEQRIEADLALGRHADLIGELEALIAENPYRERLRGALMLALYRSGRQAEALAVYQDARHALVDELGIEPSGTLQRLEKAILIQDEQLDAPSYTGETKEVVADTPSKLPTGTVTFLFTDVEGSTRLMHELGADRYAAALAEHRRSLRKAFARHRGAEVDTQGDAFFVAFSRAADAVAASDELRCALRSTPLRVRVGLHTGEPNLTADGYVGLDVPRAARIASAAHGGQIVLSETTRDLLGEDVPLRDLGRHRLKDLAEPLRLYQLGAGNFPPLRSLNSASLPVQATPLVGREHELMEVAELLRAHRLIMLTGAGGSGKTRLALQVAAEAVEEFSEGIFWVPLQALRDPELVLPMIAQAVGARNGLADHLGERRLLIVLDNLEQLLPAAQQLSDLLAQAPNVKVVGTSREPLRIRAEREYPVTPLTEHEAITLFVERAQAVRPGFAGNDAVEEICRRLDCLPLAVELAAARVTVLSPEAILSRLGRRLPLLTRGPRDVPAKQRGLRATIDWSYELLSDEERRVFDCLAVFAGGWTLEEAEVVCDSDVDTLQALTEKNLVRAESDRFSMLETIHEYASERLEESEDVQNVHERHAQVFTELAERARRELGGTQRAEWITRLKAESSNIRTAVAWVSERRPDLLRRIAVSLRVFWNMHGYLREGRSWLERSLQAAPDDVQRAELLGGLGWICHSMGDREGASRAAEERVQLARALDDPKNLSGALGLLAILADERGDPEQAEKLHEECISISLAQGGAGRPERHRGNYAEFLLRQRRYEEAAVLLHDCLATAGERGDAFLVGRYTADLGARELLQGRAASALPLLGEGVRMLHGLGDRWVTVYCLPLLAAAFAALRAHEKGARLVGAAETLLKTTEVALWADAGPVGVHRFEQTVAALRKALGDELFAALRAEGAAMSVDVAVEYALSDSD